MLFQLPDNLKQAVAIYDPELKPLIEAKQRAARQQVQRKPSNHLGMPVGFIPEKVVSLTRQEAIFTELNRTAANERHALIEENDHTVLVYHHNRVWHAYWFRTDKDSLLDQPYIYGYAIAYKAAPSTSSKVDQVCDGHSSLYTSRFNHIPAMELVKYGKVEFYQRRKAFELSDIKLGYDGTPWVLNVNQGKDSYRKREAARLFSNHLIRYIPNWGYGSATFSRISGRDKSVLQIATDRSYSIDWCEGDMTPEHIVRFFAGQLRESGEKTLTATLQTPFFRKDLALVSKQCNDLYHDFDCTDPRKIRSHFMTLTRKINNLQLLLGIYPEAPLDYQQRMYDAGQYLNEIHMGEAIAKWIAQNVPVSSFMTWFDNFIADRKLQWEDEVARSNYTYEGDTIPRVTFNMFRDTISMMAKLWQHQYDKNHSIEELQFTYTRRWRLIELHDAVSAEVWKLSTTNEKLHQDLLPEPIKIDFQGSRWTFFQPKDIHQLGQWGQAVHNCVGNASIYANGIKKRQHFIVLAMIDNAPVFTMQLSVSGDNARVDQIAGVSNSRLTEEQRYSYEQAFSLALEARNQQLAPAA